MPIQLLRITNQIRLRSPETDFLRTIFCNFLHFPSANYKSHPAKCGSAIAIATCRSFTGGRARERKALAGAETGKCKKVWCGPTGKTSGQIADAADATALVALAVTICVGIERLQLALLGRRRRRRRYRGRGDRGAKSPATRQSPPASVSARSPQPAPACSIRSAWSTAIRRTASPKIAGPLDVGAVAPWSVTHSVPIEDDEHGRVTVSRTISSGALDCKEIVFSVDHDRHQERAGEQRVLCRLDLP